MLGIGVQEWKGFCVYRTNRPYDREGDPDEGTEWLKLTTIDHFHSLSNLASSH